MLNAEAWLAIGILGFYVFDCIKLAEPNRVYFSFAFSRWNYRMPAQTLRIGRRSLDLLNPILPWQVQLQASLLSPPCKLKARVDKPFARAIASLVPIQMLLSLCLLIGLPTVLLIDGLGQAFLLMFAAVYACIVLALLKTYRQRKALHLSTTQCLNLAIECVLCSPFAVNLIRKIGFLQTDVPDAAIFARQHFAPKTLAHWREQLGRYVCEQQQWYSAEEPLHQAWQAIGKRIQGGKS